MADVQKDLIGDQTSFSLIVGMWIIIGVILGALTDSLGRGSPSVS